MVSLIVKKIHSTFLYYSNMITTVQDGCKAFVKQILQKVAKLFGRLILLLHESLVCFKPPTSTALL